MLDFKRQTMKMESTQLTEIEPRYNLTVLSCNNDILQFRWMFVPACSIISVTLPFVEMSSKCGPYLLDERNTGNYINFYLNFIFIFKAHCIMGLLCVGYFMSICIIYFSAKNMHERIVSKVLFFNYIISSVC